MGESGGRPLGRENLGKRDRTKKRGKKGTGKPQGKGLLAHGGQKSSVGQRVEGEKRRTLGLVARQRSTKKRTTGGLEKDRSS